MVECLEVVEVFVIDGCIKWVVIVFEDFVKDDFLLDVL